MTLVAVLMPFKNGARFLPAQLQSLFDQSVTNWLLWASDDGSHDDSVHLFKRSFGAQPGRCHMLDGPRAGPCANLLFLLDQVGHSADFVAYCDQDDVWDPSKLGHAIAALQSCPDDRPALFCSATTLIDAVGNKIGASPRHQLAPSFQNALIQNIASGNTMVLNAAALQLMRRCLPHASAVLHHDWWTYQLVSGAGGRVIYDTRPTVTYRQHGGNAIGAASGSRRVLAAIKRVISGDHSAVVSAHLNALTACRSELSPSNRMLLAQFAASRSRGIMGRCKGLWDTGIHRLNKAETVALWTSAVVGRL